MDIMLIVIGVLLITNGLVWFLMTRWMHIASEWERTAEEADMVAKRWQEYAEMRRNA